MHQITYISTAKPNISEAEILGILNTSIKNNTALDLTGCLVFHKGSFIQIIEGAEDHTFTTYEKIKEDTRHTNVSLVWEGSCAKRIFPTWEMAFHRSCKHDAEEMGRFEKNLLLLSEFSARPTAATGLFWHEVKKLLNLKYS